MQDTVPACDIVIFIRNCLLTINKSPEEVHLCIMLMKFSHLLDTVLIA